MKIGVLTYHRSHNNGALLQAIALREYLSSLGHDVYYIDYWPDYHKSMYAIYDTKSFIRWPLKSIVKYIIKTTLLIPRKIKRINVFKKFISFHIEPFTKPYTDKEEYDLIIYGSDQIWRKQYGLNDRFNPVYFGENILKGRKKISYAASMGVINCSKEEEKYLTDRILKFDGIGVREGDLKSLLTGLCIKNVCQNIDPTLVIDKNYWSKKFNLDPVVGEPYALYFDLLGNSFNKEAVKEYARDKGLRFITLGSSVYEIIPKEDLYDTGSPEQFLSLIKNAEIIFTSSFHGMAFSIIFQKNFFVSFPYNKGRAESLLGILGIDKRMLDSESSIPENIEAIDYVEVASRLEAAKNSSKEFLDMFIK